MDNLDIYNALKQPPKEALRTIPGGRLAGKTDINPQWRYKAMTERFGVCGIGWKYEIVRVFSELADEGQIFAFAEVNLFIKQGDWSDPIPGYGGSMLVEKEKAGLHASDEGYKMAITDALSTAMKMLGVAADIYAGLWDGTKYRDSGEGPKETVDPKGHWCSIHKTPFFKKGKMKDYAHPIKDENENDTGEWCNESATKQAKAPVEEQDFENLGKPETPQDTPAPMLGHVDGQWFRENLAKIQNNKGDAWSNEKLRVYLTKSFHVEGETIEKLVANLGKEFAGYFVAKIEKALASIDKESKRD